MPVTRCTRAESLVDCSGPRYYDLGRIVLQPLRTQNGERGIASKPVEPVGSSELSGESRLGAARACRRIRAQLGDPDSPDGQRSCHPRRTQGAELDSAGDGNDHPCGDGPRLGGLSVRAARCALPCHGRCHHPVGVAEPRRAADSAGRPDSIPGCFDEQHDCSGPDYDKRANDHDVRRRNDHDRIVTQSTHTRHDVSVGNDAFVRHHSVERDDVVIGHGRRRR